MKGVNESLDSIYHFNIYHHSGGTWFNLKLSTREQPHHKWQRGKSKVPNLPKPLCNTTFKADGGIMPSDKRLSLEGGNR